MARQWTKPQNDAINALGGSVLVSAAAGSGKTAVLTQRVVSLLLDERNPVDADRLLIVTFSNAAAAEMKQRISAKLSEMIRENPRDLFLQRQQALLPAAQISTIHAFCIELLRRNFQSLGIPPDFGVADENELILMKNEIASACIEEAYEKDENGEFSALLETLISGTGDKALIEAILKIYDFSRSHPFPEDWLHEKLKLYDPDTEVAKTIWGASLLSYAKKSLAFCVKSTEAAIRAFSGDEAVEKAYGAAFSSDLVQFKSCLKAAAANDWDTLVASLAAYTPERLGGLRGGDALGEHLKSMRQSSKDIVKELSEKYINAQSAAFRQDIADLKPKIELLFALVKEFSERFKAEKAKKNRLDFSDFEHLALELLIEKTKDGYVRTEKAKEISEQFEHVMVDEYQDTNEVQDLIFTSISRSQENLFMVGDVKQSIYAFRQAMPEIFTAKRRSFFPYGSGMFPAKINLDTNFRSRREVTSAVNFLFSILMSEENGGVDYRKDESLKCGAVYPEYGGAKPVLLLTLMENDAEGKDSVTLEAETIAGEIAGMIESGYMVTENGVMRKASPRDFCILLRAAKNRAEVYARELNSRGIAAVSENGGGYFAAREVSSVICMLKAVDNPLLDVELIAAMLSPFFDFTNDDVARIRLNARDVPFFTALARTAESDEKAAGFLKIFRELRAKSAILPADRLIMSFYEMTSAISIAQAMPMGEVRAANLRLLVHYASEYHALGYKQLGGFIGFVGRLEEKKQDLSPAGFVKDGADAVRIMSIHRSKGLEFPVVFLADTAKQFNMTDLRARYLLHSRYGFACLRRDYKAFKQFATVPMQSVRLETERVMRSEEMRILYVALTRAREKLIISAAVKSPLKKRLASLRAELENHRLPGYLVGRMNSYAGWILSALLYHESAGALREFFGAREIETIPGDTDWEFIIRGRDEAEDVPAPDRPEASALPDEAFLAELKARASYTYAFLPHTEIPAKLAVSDVAKGERGLLYHFSQRPRFMTAEALTPAEKGNAMHKFMQFASYENAKENLDDEIENIRRESFLSPLEAESLDKKRLKAFFKSTLADRIFSSEKVFRELKFMSECGGDVLFKMYPDMPKDAQIALQGVADCVFIEDGEAVIVDYKTDIVTDSKQLLERYGKQLSLYRMMLEESLGVPVKECAIYSFWLSAQVKL
ncbi:MAG: helicase-exonuclease AddAB subunit AddA [Oscillospiraceae bacterium]|nr:helicase-exonuclease AddAB subunit AddA [Oscillospiraceae bacterium]